MAAKRARQRDARCRPTVLYYDPETLTAYEGGSKRALPTVRCASHASVFHYDYKGLQLSFQSNSCGGPYQITTNAGAAKVDGIEVEASLHPHPNHRFDFGVNYLDARYDRFIPRPGIDFAGRDLDRSPAPHRLGGL